jgi:dynein heavy chain
MTKPMTVAKKMFNELMDFKDYVPIIRALCNPGLQQRHIDAIFMLLGANKDQCNLPDMDIKQLMYYNLLEKKDGLEELSEMASKEFQNQNTMIKMKEDWEPLAFTCKEVQGKDSYILDGEAVEQIQAALDDHIIKTQTMKGSPYAKFMLDEIADWEKVLNDTQENLDMWLKVQAVWMYLEPVFSSDDIINQMPVEGRNFKEVNISWHNLMNQIHDNPSALDVIKIETLGETLRLANAKLEKVQKGLNEYLESKRTLFPRFYFLSNDELLEILSETKDPLRVQPHLKKCFEGIDKLKFDDEKKIHGMYSIEGEYVPYTRVIDTVASKGAVEDWLVQVEDVMLKSVKQVIEQSYQDYLKKSRDKWITLWQGQAVLGVSMMFWTMQAEEAMKKS